MVPPRKQHVASKTKKFDWLNLPRPPSYEAFPREAPTSLHLDLFDGLKFDLSKELNQSFSLSHSVFMGSVEVHYEFDANFLHQKSMIIRRMLTDGIQSAQVHYNLTDNVAMKINAQLTNDLGLSKGVLTFEYKGSDFRTLFKIENDALFGANYIQSISPHVSLCSEIQWLGRRRTCEIGVAARYNTDKMVVTGQFGSNGIFTFSYVQRVSEKVSLASSFMRNYMTPAATLTVGYDYNLRKCRLRGTLDSNGAVAAVLEKGLKTGLTFILSAEVDHGRKDYNFGYGMSLGE